MWCTRWFLPLLLLPLPTAPPYFLVLFLLTLALHARPCFYCIVLLAALFLSSCYWQSFPLDAHLSGPWANNITFSEALTAALPPHLSTLDFTPPIVRVADRCWCDFASGPFEPYDVQKWEMDSVQRAVAQIERQWKQSLGPDSPNTTAAIEPPPVESHQTLHVLSTRNGTLASIFRSLFTRRSIKSELPQPSSSLADTITPPDTPTKPSVVQPSIRAEPSLVPGQLDMRPFGFELIFDLRWSRRS